MGILQRDDILSAYMVNTIIPDVSEGEDALFETHVVDKVSSTLYALRKEDIASRRNSDYVRVLAEGLEGDRDVFTSNQLPKDSMLAVKMRRFAKRQEPLRARPSYYEAAHDNEDNSPVRTCALVSH